MPDYDFRTPRVHVDAPLAAGCTVPFDRGQANHLHNVLRLGPDDEVLLFNGRDGEWQARLTAAGKRDFAALVARQVRGQSQPYDLNLLFAPLKHARLDYMVQKAVEMGVSRLQPVITRYTQVARVNVERMRGNVVEAAQQCGILVLPAVCEPVRFDDIVETGRLLVFCDEHAEVGDPLAALKTAPSNRPLSIVIGPEGGFTEDERQAFLKRDHVLRIALGPRILRADTAAVAALALVQAVRGDWRGG